MLRALRNADRRRPPSLRTTPIVIFAAETGPSFVARDRLRRWLLEQAQDLGRGLVRDSQDRKARLTQDLGTRQVRGLLGEVGVHDLALRFRDVLQSVVEG